jgi:hypothetical protein
MKWREKGQNRTRKVCRFKEKKGSVTAKLILSRAFRQSSWTRRWNAGTRFCSSKARERDESRKRNEWIRAPRMVFAAKIRAQVQYLRTRQQAGRNGRFIYPLFSAGAYIYI